MSTVIRCYTEGRVYDSREPFEGPVAVLQALGYVESVAVTSSGQLREQVWGLMEHDPQPVTEVAAFALAPRRPELGTQPDQEHELHPAIRLLEEWLADESGYDEETWPKLKKALDEDRLSSRRLFRD